tara:strand:- start:173 stop:397 length:225 start_codon:yes stop_codon:yes gene_type:complete
MLFADLTNPQLADLVGTDAALARVFLNAVGVDFPTPEMTQDARDAACYGLEWAVLCTGEDTTECGQVIPNHAFN